MGLTRAPAAPRRRHQGQKRDYAWVRAGQLYPLQEHKAVMEVRAPAAGARLRPGCRHTQKRRRVCARPADRRAAAAAQAQAVKKPLLEPFNAALLEARASRLTPRAHGATRAPRAQRAKAAHPCACRALFFSLSATHHARTRTHAHAHTAHASRMRAHFLFLARHTAGLLFLFTSRF